MERAVRGGGRYGGISRAIGVGALVMVLGGCTSSATTPSGGSLGPASGTVTPAATGPGPDLEGYYTLFLASKKAAIRRYEIGGPWVANIYPNGRLTMQGPARGCCSLVSKTSVTGNRITVYAHGQYDHCTGSGVYTWKTTGRGLRFTVVQDDCVVRALLFSEPWTFEGAPG
jgi:hypothetical protein